MITLTKPRHAAKNVRVTKIDPEYIGAHSVSERADYHAIGQQANRDYAAHSDYVPVDMRVRYVRNGRLVTVRRAGLIESETTARLVTIGELAQ